MFTDWIKRKNSESVKWISCEEDKINMWNLIENVVNSPEFLSTIMGSLIGGVFTVLMFFLQNNVQKNFLKQQKIDDDGRLEMQNNFQEQLLAIQNEFYRETVEIREKYERKRMLIGYLKEKIDILMSVNNEINNFINNSKNKYEEAVRNFDKKALIEWMEDFEKIHYLLTITLSNIEWKRLNEKADGKTYRELFLEITDCIQSLIENVRGNVNKPKQIDWNEGMRIYSKVDELLRQSRVLLIIEKNKMFDMLDSIDDSKVDII